MSTPDPRIPSPPQELLVTSEESEDDDDEDDNKSNLNNFPTEPRLLYETLFNKLELTDEKKFLRFLITRHPHNTDRQEEQLAFVILWNQLIHLLYEKRYEVQSLTFPLRFPLVCGFLTDSYLLYYLEQLIIFSYNTISELIDRLNISSVDDYLNIRGVELSELQELLTKTLHTISLLYQFSTETPGLMILNNSDKCCFEQAPAKNLYGNYYEQNRKPTFEFYYLLLRLFACWIWCSVSYLSNGVSERMQEMVNALESLTRLSEKQLQLTNQSFKEILLKLNHTGKIYGVVLKAEYQESVVKHFINAESLYSYARLELKWKEEPQSRNISRQTYKHTNGRGKLEKDYSVLHSIQPIAVYYESVFKKGQEPTEEKKKYSFKTTN